MENVNKPLILEIEEAKAETNTAINDILKKHNLPCYLYEPIIEDIHRQISSIAQNEVATIKANYKSEVEASKKVKEEDTSNT